MITRRTLLTLPATLYAAEPKVVVPTYNTLSDAEEIALGRKFAASLEKDLPILSVSALDSYINGILTALGRKSRRPNIPYIAKVANTVDVNAVSLPGGFIYVYRGLLEMVKTESELASVLSHEVGHIVGRHSANNLMLDFRARQVYEIVKRNLELRNTVIEEIIERLGGPLVILARLRYGRELEFESDLLGHYNMVRANWDPAGMVSFFKRLSLTRKDPGDWVDSALATHPDPTERAQRIQAEIAVSRLPSGLTTNTMSFGAMKLGLKLLPSPVRPAKK